MLNRGGLRSIWILEGAQGRDETDPREELAPGVFETLCIVFAFVLGLAARRVGLPPLVGFLGAGFLLNAFGPSLGLPEEAGGILHHVAHLGVLLLLFTVGLKIKLKPLLQPEVLGGGSLHFAITVGLLSPSLHFALGVDWRTAVLLSIALAFSSTVLAAKVLDAKRELRAFHGRVAIGILILQDLFALTTMTLAGEGGLSPWALGVLALPLLRPALGWLLDQSGHEELLVLMGMLVALVLGGMAFEAVGLSSELGALLMGVMLAGHKRSQELSDSLWSLKELFLVGFFLEIGMSGLPGWNDLWFALLLLALVPLKAALFFHLLVRFRLRARNAFLAALALACYSEFGLIVAGAVLPEYLVPLALTVALSFVIAAPLNRVAHGLFERWEKRLVPFQKDTYHPDEQPASVDGARVLVFGMGRAGTAAYDLLTESGLRVVGLDSDPTNIERQSEQGRDVRYADAEDSCLWSGLDLRGVEGVVLAMSDQESARIATRQLRQRGFQGVIAAHSVYEDHARELRELGADSTYLTMQQAGRGLGESVRRKLEASPQC